MLPIVATVHEVRARIAAWKKEDLSVGLVPTMGYLHEGHQSLMERAVRENDRVVVSIFVNPLQFGPHEDLEEYPRDPDRDRRCCENAGVHLLFRPELQAMYPPVFHTSITVSELTTGLCGKSRPAHFGGVCTVVCKLFNIIGPNRAYFGQKDAQQLAVIRQMTQDLNIPTDIIACPIVREHDGLAKSSRNIYLLPEERAAALTLNRSLQLAAQAVADGERKSAALTAVIKKAIAAQALIRIDYIEVVDPSSMQPVQQLDGPTLIALAAYVGKARLLDNLIVSPQ